MLVKNIWQLMELTKAEISALAKGDTKIFKKLYESFFVALCVFARNFSLEKEEAEDVVQEVFCRIYDDKMLFNELNSLKSYLYSSVRNRCLNYIRDKKRRLNHEACFLDAQETYNRWEDLAMENEIYRQLVRLMDELPPQCRNIFQRTLNGDTSEKIATDLNLSIETVKTQRKKAKKLLRERYALLFKTFGILL